MTKHGAATAEAEPKRPVEAEPGTDVAARGAGTEVMPIDYGDDAGKGGEGITSSEYRLPFLRILQALSPQVKPPSAGGIPGAKVGMVINTSTGELYEEFDFIPAHRDSNYVEYVPRDAGGGFVGIRPMDDPEVDALRAKHGRFGKLPTDRATEFVETYYLFGLAIPKGASPFMCVVGFASSQIGKYQSFVARYMAYKYPNAAGKTVQPPLWAHRWHFGTKFEKRKKGEFYSWNITLAEKNADGTEKPSIASRLKLTDPLYVEAKGLYELIASGKAKADMSGAAPEREPGEDHDDPPM